MWRSDRAPSFPDEAGSQGLQRWPSSHIRLFQGQGFHLWSQGFGKGDLGDKTSLLSTQCGAGPTAPLDSPSSWALAKAKTGSGKVSLSLRPSAIIAPFGFLLVSPVQARGVPNTVVPQGTHHSRQTPHSNSYPQPKADFRVRETWVQILTQVIWQQAIHFSSWSLISSSVK